jgi:hypothetical protein
MTFTEERKDIFQYDSTWKKEPFYYAHCISADFALGAGIAVDFKKRYRLTPENLISGRVYENLSIVGNVFNLITKDKYWQKPTYASLAGAVDNMKKYCVSMGVKKLIMPRIGCGLDRLNWDMVKHIIKERFAETDIDITVCYISEARR